MTCETSTKQVVLRCFFLLALVWGFQATTVGQTVNGAFHGTVTDASGAVVPNAVIEVKNLSTGALRHVTTNDIGSYTVTQLPPGHYSISVSRTGFAGAVRPDVELLVNQDLGVDFALSVGEVSQRVEVTAAPSALKTTSATVGQVIGSKPVVDLPLNGRQFTQLALLTPGAAPKESGQQAFFVIPIGGGGISPSVNGQRGQQNNFTLDGVLNNAIFDNTWAYSPPPDAIQEFNVQSHITDAGFGISSGANINVVTKSGTNQIHGSVWEFLRNDRLDAANFFDNFSSLKKPPFRQNQFGFAVGGPVFLPTPWGLWDGRKHRTYFFGSFEGFESREGFNEFNSVPTPNELNGDFSDLLTTKQAVDPTTGQAIVDPLGRPVLNGQIYDPMSSRTVTGGQVDPVTGLTAQSSGLVRDPFPGNIIPQGRLSPQALLYIKTFFPLPNFGPGGNSFPNFSGPSEQKIRDRTFQVRVDQTFSNNDTLFGSFYFATPEETFPSALLNDQTTGTNAARVFALGYTHLFSPNFLGTFHYGYNKTNFGQFIGGLGNAPLLSALGLEGFEPVRDGIPIVPQISLAPRLGGTGEFAIPLGPIRTHQFSGDFQVIHGSHTFSFGYMFYHIHSFDDGFGASIGFDQFPTSATFGSNQNLSTTGDGLASALLNVPSNLFGFVGDTAADDRTTWKAFYVQEKWQASKKLNIQIGVRYDYVPPASFLNNHVSGFNPECPVPPQGSLTTQTAINNVIQSCFLIPVPFVQPPTPGFPNPPSFPFPNVRKTFFDPKYGTLGAIQPRFGFAYALRPSTVIRGGFAAFGDHNNTLVQESQDPRIAWPFGAGISLGGLNRGVPTLFFTNLPSASSFLPPANPIPNLAFAADPRLKIPYSMEYNFGIQQAIKQKGFDMMATVEYVGSLSRDLFIQPCFNCPAPGPGPVASRAPFPFLGQFPADFNSGVANYNALQAKVENRFSNNMTFLASYTYSHCLSEQDEGQSGSIQDPRNIHADYGNCDFNIPHVFTLSGTYVLPFGKGQYFGRNAGRAFDAAIGGWQVSGIATLESGSPFTITVPFDNANINPSSETQRADRVPGVPLLPRGFKQTQAAFYNPAAFALPAPFTFGNLGRNTLRGPKFGNLDFSAQKSFVIPGTESRFLNVRADFFNILNNVNFSPPGGGSSGGFSTLGGESQTSVATPTFLGIFSAATSREIQFSLKLVF